MSLNREAKRIFDKIEERQEELGCSVSRCPNGVTLLDAGVNVPGSIEAGRLIGEICMGGLGKVDIGTTRVGDLELAAVDVSTERVMLATLCAQYAGWSIKVDGYFAMASGPARALARVEKLYDELGCRDESDVAVIVLETRQLPSDRVTGHIAEKCGVSTSDLYCVVVPTASVAGSVQISSRVVEVGVHKLHLLGFDLRKVRRGRGRAPIAPVAKNDSRAMGVTNDCILYGGTTVYDIESSGEDDLQRLVTEIPSSSSSQYGTPFYDLFKSVEFNFYRLDPHLFSPAEVTLRDMTTGREYRAGSLNVDVLRRSIGM
ncbi:MAG: methenyltetrahydromethanopterin cyclohydrolase [Candidatus Thorarchaeota archaeon]